MSDTLLDVRELSVSYSGYRGHVTAVNKVSFTIAKGETLALIG